MGGNDSGASAGPNDDKILRPAEVARLFRVNPKTVTRWAKTGKLPCIRTPGGHRRYRTSVVIAFLNDFRGDDEELLSPSEVGKLFRVNPKTVTRWAKTGKLSCVCTLGGHRRYRASEVWGLINDNS